MSHQLTVIVLTGFLVSIAGVALINTTIYTNAPKLDNEKLTMAVFTTDCWANLSEHDRNASESFGDPFGYFCNSYVGYSARNIALEFCKTLE